METTNGISPDAQPISNNAHPTFREALWVWCRVAMLSFGGPAGQIAVMHRILVEEKRWVSENRFLHALNYCMLLPGPEAQQLATYIGWLLHRTVGGLVAGLLFVLPGFVSILVLSVLYAGYQDLSLVQGIFYGLKPAVVAVVIEAVIRIGKRSLKNRIMVLIAALAFVAIFFFQVPFPLIVLAAAMVGYAGGRLWPDTFVVIKGHATKNDEPNQHVIADDHTVAVRPSLKRTLGVLVVWLLIWFLPIAGLLSFSGSNSVYSQESLFFSKTAVVTFGGAYSVLAYIAQEAVETHHWLGPGEMLDGLGMAETTPGPLIQVVQFVGFMGAYRNPGELHPMLAGVIGSVVTTWVTFVPCFLWIFLGAPYIEYLRRNPSLNAALSTITAAVVGVVLNLSIWFSLHTIFGKVSETHAFGAKILIPNFATLDLAALIIATAAFVAMFRFKTGMISTLGLSAVIGLIWFLIRG
ncbi:chromate efflux transporter [Aeoliella sp.]|uniref:chromate efflux transporter n=1 Tax=Aeoliella sp. TaxID=2795800 RepID=UPI003CCC1D71